MISGARQTRPNRLRRLVAEAAARQLVGFAVPGPEVARAHGLDLEAAGLPLADTPRHAGVLVVVGELPPGLQGAASIAYAQMPRPRAILGVGAGDISPLPTPDASAGMEQGALADAVTALRRSFAEGAFSAEAPEFDAEGIRTRTEYACPMHPEITSDRPGSCPKCGMDLVPRESAGGMDHGRGHGEGLAHTDHSGHEGMGHDHMDHAGMGFMSMVEITKDLPRSPDGLPMEWVEAPFGPLFPGLPGGLSLTLTLDGDTVAGAEAASAVGEPDLRGLAGEVAGFVDALAELDPLSPVAHGVLAMRVMEDATGTVADEPEVLARVGALERERAASHLGWLAGFAHLIGYAWLERRAARLQLAVMRAEGVEEIVGLRAEAQKVARRVERAPLVGRRLRGIGRLPGNAEARGPVTRAGGRADDSRAGDEIYLGLGFEPVLGDGDDALSRMRVRLEETERSLDLAAKVGRLSAPRPVVLGGATSGEGAASVETPRGTATLGVELAGGIVSRFELDAPSSRHLALVRAASEGEELADALVGVASLDLSPWEVVR